jgi:transcriptional regulator with XRE-family HTH domain
MIERIKKIIEIKKMNAGQFADEIGVQRSALSHVLSGRNNPSLDFMLRIKKQFPELNLDWLLIGIGNMMENVVAEKPKEVKPEKLALEIEFPDKAETERPTQIHVQNEPELKKAEKSLKNSMIVSGKKIPKQVILLFDDNTFELFDSKSND